MLLQTNSYIVPKDKRAEHARLLRRFRAALAKLGCDSFEVYEQVGANWNTGEPTGRYVQIMRFRDRRHQVAVQQAERNDPASQAIIAEFCQLINFPYQQQQGLFAVGFYNSALPVAPVRPRPGEVAGAAAAAPAVEEAATEFDQPVPEVEEPAAEMEADAADPAADAGADDLADGPFIDETTVGQETPEVESSADAADAEPPAPEMHAVEAPAEATAVHESNDDEVQDLGALLDAHLTRPLDEEGLDGHPLDDAEGHADRPNHLDALDLADLALPDEPASDPRRAADHAAR